jgi:hypothetical protein
VDNSGPIYGITNNGITNNGSGSITSHGAMVAGIGNTAGGRADLIRDFARLRAALDRSADQLSTSDRQASRVAVEDIGAELRKDTPEQSRLVEGIGRLMTAVKPIGGVLAEAVKLSDAVRSLIT